MRPDPDYWEEHSHVYNLYQNINSLGDVLQPLWNLLDPLCKGQAPSAWYQMNPHAKLNEFDSILFNNMLMREVS